MSVGRRKREMRAASDGPSTESFIRGVTGRTREFDNNQVLRARLLTIWRVIYFTINVPEEQHHWRRMTNLDSFCLYQPSTWWRWLTWTWWSPTPFNTFISLSLFKIGRFSCLNNTVVRVVWVHVIHKVFQKRTVRGLVEVWRRYSWRAMLYANLLYPLYREKSKPYSHCILSWLPPCRTKDHLKDAS